MLIVAALWAGFLPAAALASEQDTKNGVAPVKPGETQPTPPAGAEKPHTDGKGTAETKPAGPAPSLPLADASHPSDVQRYCQNVAAAAAEARYAWQVKKLTDLQTQVAKAVSDLEARQAELKDVLARREDALKRADATIVGIFSKMKADAAAAQMSALDDDTAAAILQQLNPRAASAILGEIAPDRAVRLVNTIAGTPPADGKKS